jgi:murein L,D-transpeptidase YafK
MGLNSRKLCSAGAIWLALVAPLGMAAGGTGTQASNVEAAQKGAREPAKSRSQKRSPNANVRVTSIGAAAIERTRQRLSFAYSDVGLSLGAPLYLRLIRDQARLEVWAKQRTEGTYVRLRTFKLCGKGGVLGPRQSANTGQAEGFYAISPSQMRPAGVTYLGFGFGWPNAYDQKRGWKGAPSLVQAGCTTGRHYGLTDQDMEEVYTMVYFALRAGQASVPLHIFPFQMSPFKMLQIGTGAKANFWNELAPAWQAFERTKTPPQVRVQGRRYRIIEAKPAN